jgi:Restriction endonuclease
VREQPRVVPFIRDLNPQRDDFAALLRRVDEADGDRAALARAVFDDWTTRGTRRNFSLHSIEANTLSSLSSENLGIVGGDNRLTAFGRELLEASDDEDRLRDILGSYLLRERGGWQFAKALAVLQQRGQRVTRQNIATYLQEKYGIAEEWADLNNISSLHSFLEWCGVVSNYRLNEDVFERLLDVSVGEIQLLEGFTLETRACLETLVRLGVDATPALVRQGAGSALHRPIDANQLPMRMQPLIDVNLVELAPGRRGDRTRRYRLTNARKGEALAAVAADIAILGVVPDEVFEHDLAWVVARLWDETLSHNERGRTLEVLAGMIYTRLGLRHIQLRNRTEFEVDVTADYVGSGYQTWSAQCKAYGRSRVTSEHILREFGIAVLDRFAVLVFVTTSDFTDDAVLTADRIVRETNIQVIRVNGDDLRSLADDESRLFRLFRDRSERARRVRLGARPSEVFMEFDASREWLLTEKPDVDEVWAHVQRRDLLVERALAATFLAAWLETQRGDDRFDEDYLERVRLKQ